MKRPLGEQAELFEAPGAARTLGAAEVPPEMAAAARALPDSVRFGTSSWAFPGWAGLVYDGEASPTALARDGLAAYARHPLLRAVGLDRTFYAPIPAAEFARYASQVPEHFRFLVKAHGDLTTPGGLHRPRSGRIAGQGARVAGGSARAASASAAAAPAGLFLDPEHATRQVVAPAVEGLADRLGVILFQFPPLRLSSPQVARFPERLAAFLASLPRGVPYAVEIRNRELLTTNYAAALAAHGATHCYTVHPSMPDVLEQRAVIGEQLDGAGTVAVRWMLRPDQHYESARSAWAPFNALAAPDLSSRTRVAELLGLLVAAGTPAIVIANNKAEGSAPRTLAELARLVTRTSVDRFE